MSSRVLGSERLPSPGEIRAQFGVVHGLGPKRRGVLTADQARKYRRILEKGDPLECEGIIRELAILLDKSPGPNWGGGTHSSRRRGRAGLPASSR